jgi:hypothetical protein
MQASQEILKDLAIRYADSGKSVIPVNGKKPYILNWSKFCEELTTEEALEKMDFSTATGLGLCLGKSSGICCIDIDTTSEENYSKIRAIIQNSPCGKVGNKGATFFYRLPETKVRDIITHKFGNGDMVEFFFGKKQTVIPPSVHPDTKEQYRWIGEPLSPNYDTDNLPVFDITIIDDIERLSKNNIVKDIDRSFTSGRNNALSNHFGKVLSTNNNFMWQVHQLLEYDRLHHQGNELFTSREDGMNYDMAVMNAIKFHLNHYNSVLKNAIAGKAMDMPPDFKGMITLEELRTITFDKIKPITDELFYDEFKDEWIPEQMREWIKNYSKATSYPIDQLFLTCLCSLSSLIGTKARIYPTKNDKSWKESANIYIMLVAAAGGGKSGIAKLARMPLDNLQKAIDEKFEDGNNKRKTEFKIKKSRIKALESKFNSAVSNEDINEAERINAELQQLLLDTVEVKKRQLTSGNVTPEKLIDIISNSKYGHFHVCSELSVLINQLGKKGYELLESIHLDLYNDGRIYYDTISRGAYDLTDVSLSILCSAQTSVFASCLNDLVQNKQGDNGYLHRYIPAINLARSFEFDENVSNETVVPFEIQKIYNLAYAFSAGTTISSSECGNKEFLRIKKKTINEWYKMNTSDSTLKSGISAKSRGHIVKIAFLLEFIKSSGNITEISSASVKEAECIVNNCYEKMILIHEGKMDKVPQFKDEIIAVIKAGLVSNGFSSRDLLRSSNKLLQDKDSFNQTIDKMTECNYFKVVEDKKIGTKRYYINPEIFS